MRSLTLSCTSVVVFVMAESETMTCVWITHRLEELEYADAAALLDDGKLHTVGDADKVLRALKAR